MAASMEVATGLDMRSAGKINVCVWFYMKNVYKGLGRQLHVRVRGWVQYMIGRKQYQWTTVESVWLLEDIYLDEYVFKGT